MLGCEPGTYSTFGQTGEFANMHWREIREISQKQHRRCCGL
jgi:hypothetical protein